MRLILNQVKTPDGTVLTSYHVHDFKEHLDKNGETYMVDGGTYYARRNINFIPAEEQSIYEDAPFDIVRENLHWGTRGKEGNKILTWVLLKDMSTAHIKNIIKNIPKLDPMFATFFSFELALRQEQKPQE